MKKLLTSLVAAAVTLTTAVASVASAAGYNPNKDPNGDGVITVADATYIRQCLMGRYKLSDLTQLDVDDNAVVSEVDAMCILMHDAGVLSMSLPETDSMNAVSASESSEVYAVYDAKTGKYKRMYSLSVMNYDDSVSTNDVVSGNYNPSENYSNRGVAKIMCSDYGAGYKGTGFVVGKHTIATAAHCLFVGRKDGCERIDDILLFNADENPVAFTPVECHIPSEFRTNSLLEKYSPNCDYALITVKEDLSDYMSFNIGTITNEASNLLINVAGFPGTENGITYNTYTQHFEELATGSITSVDDNVFYHSANAINGDSGGVVYVSETLNGKTYTTAVGIHVGGPLTENANGYNTSVRFTAEVLKFLVGNTNISY